MFLICRGTADYAAASLSSGLEGISYELCRTVFELVTLAMVDALNTMIEEGHIPASGGYQNEP
jgi:hypothetical protein